MRILTKLVIVQMTEKETESTEAGDQWDVESEREEESKLTLSI